MLSRTLVESSEKKRLQFLNTELDLSWTLAEKSLGLFQAGDLEDATVAASAAKLGYKNVCKSLRNLAVNPAQRETLESKRARLEVLIKKLRAIREH